MTEDTARIVALDTCTSCGLCVEECPGLLLHLEGLDNRAKSVRAWEARCITCGHCVAICPEGALVLPAMAPEDCREYKAADLPSPDQAALLLRARRSVRAYKNKPVPRATVEALLDVARYAPSAVNSQGVYWTIVDGHERVRSLAAMVIDWMRASLERSPGQAGALGIQSIVEAWGLGHDRILRAAPTVLVAHSPVNAVRADVNCHIALTYLELAAFASGLGTCWAGYLYGALSTHPPVAEFLGIPEDHHGHGAMMLGYPKHRYHRIPTREPLHADWI
jgi:nitroreductase/NAD-dependent dihydropyrimidine dehydrogenase PreA subunit